MLSLFTNLSMKKIDTNTTTWARIAKNLKSVTRYFITGGIVYLVDVLTFSLIVLATPDYYQAANIVARLTGAIIGFFLHKYFTFSDNQQTRNKKTQLFQYTVLFTTNICFSAALLYLLIDQFRSNPFVARIITDVLVISASYLVSRYIIFK